MKEKIVPSAPFKNYGEIEILAQKVSGNLKKIQIDVCDGKFVKNVSWPFTDYSKTDFAKLIEKPDLDVYLPSWESVNYSVDLMVENPEKYIESFVAYGIDEVVVHYRSLKNVQEQFEKIVSLCEQFNLSLVVAVDVKTDMKVFLKFAKESLVKINSFQVMGIENIGLQGQEFAEESLEIVKTLKKNFPDKKVQFDGAINEETMEEIKDAGVDIFCVGSFLTKAFDFEENLSYLKKVLHN